ncbi:hypothetical protein LOZ58_006450 [Ophidiomyces ophidiicola]|nr:hypothetical protein LOZ58_006450 [Ophidiomyces ophidiicola]
MPDPSSIDVVVVGNGPSALILSYILHGNIPFYDPQTPHPDPILHEKLVNAPDLLDLDIPALTNHFEASRFSYSTQALPVNALLDALVRPNADIDDTGQYSCIQWRRLPEKVVPHLVLGNALEPGGQWTECPSGTTWDIQSLSYAGMLSLPGYSFQAHHRKLYGSTPLAFTRPSRCEIAEYFAAYPLAVGISDAIKSSETVANISRTDEGFYIASHNLICKSLVLASGIFAEVKPARPLLQPLLNKTIAPLEMKDGDRPLLIVGSGFSAADIIISAPAHRRMIHIFKWEPDERPSPLKSCHQQAYPEYAGIYRLMKRCASIPTDGSTDPKIPFRPSTLSPFLRSREWGDVYEGLPNTLITDVVIDDHGALVTLKRDDGTILRRHVSDLAYAVGRQGSLDYMDQPLRAEILPRNTNAADTGLISASTLREAALCDLELAPRVYVIGSLTGDSLIRFSYGGCVYVAGKIIRDTFNEKESVEYQAGWHHRKRAITTNGFQRECRISEPGQNHNRAQDAKGNASQSGFIWAKGRLLWDMLFSWSR